MRTLLVSVLVLVGLTEVASAQRAKFQLERNRLHADVPFHIDLVVEGFDEAPAPDQPPLDIAGATVTPIGVEPRVSRSIQIVNGRRTDSKTVTWVLRWRVIAPSAGVLRVPSLTVKQDGKSATAPAGEVAVESVPTTDEMKLRLVLPDRPVFIGETVPVKLEWLFRPEPESQSFSVPLASLDAFTIGAPPAPPRSRNVLSLAVGAKDLDVPYELDRTTADGREYNRLTVTLFAAPKQPGTLTIPPASVVAALRVGRPDFFGNAATRLFRAADVSRTLEVRPLPQADRPATFAGAVGEQFSIAVRTSRSVVSLGEPVELAITIKSDQRLEALALGKLDGPERLPKDRFTVAEEAPTGELSDDGKTKTFRVVAQVTGPATEIPALAFSYFDPRKAAYHTIHSDPIALSVKGGSVVDATSVVTTRKGPAADQGAPTDEAIDVGAELALSSPGAALDRPLGGSLLWLLVGGLYAVPLLVLALRTYQLRTSRSREEAGEVRAARRRVEELLDRAETAPAREIAGPLVAAFHELARVLGRDVPPSQTVLATLETEAFAPDAAGKPLSPDLRSDAAGLLRRWLADARRSRGGPRAAGAAAILLALAPGSARADSLDEGRHAYQYAMAQTGDATARKTAFARAAAALGQAAREHPGRPELLVDWGNAALGGGDVATATLAFRRALAIDPGNPRARRNLAYLRGKLPELYRPMTPTGAADTLLFFHRWPRERRMLVGAAAFAIAVLLVVPWSGRRRASATALATIPLAIWLAMLGSLVLEDRHRDDAIVMDGVVLRAADHAGAPAAVPQPLPRGAEVTLLERRDSWSRIELASKISGWVPDGAIVRVAE
jgi:hypothetical protein